MTDVVDRLVKIWQVVLRDETLHADSDVNDAGGTSLTGVRIIAHIRAEFGRDVDLAEFFENPTPRAVADLVASAPVWTDDDFA